MKRNILLLFGLVGLVALEWGCKDDEEFVSYEYTLTGINSSIWLPHSQDMSIREISLEDVSLDVKFESDENIVARLVSNSELYALSPNNIHPVNGLDSITVYSNNLDVTSSFYLSKSQVNLWELTDKYLRYGNRPPLSLNLKISKNFITTSDTFQFNLKFYSQDSSVLETTTDSIILVP